MSPSTNAWPRAAARLRNVLGAALLAALGCEVADFDVQKRGTATIPRDAMLDPIEMMQLDGFELVLAEIEDTEDIGPEDISGAELRRLTLEVIDPAGGDLSFLDSIEIYAESPELERVRVAHRERLPKGEARVDLEIDDVDLHDYVAAPSVTLSAVVDGVAPPEDVRVRAIASLNIGATLRGACDHG